MYIPFAVFCFVFPWAILLMSLDLMPFGMEWMSSLLLAMLGLSAGAWLALNYGSRGFVKAVAVFALGVAVEYVGVSTGFPFGRYSYTGVLVPPLPGGVPLAIGFAWVFIIVAGLFTARWALAALRINTPAFVVYLLGAVLATGLDLLLEPVAYHVKDYWRWLDPGPYYGVPFANFAAWLLCALAFSLLVGGASRRSLRLPWLPGALYTMNALMFGIVNVAHGMWIPGLICVVLLAFVLSAISASRHTAPALT